MLFKKNNASLKLLLAINGNACDGAQVPKGPTGGNCKDKQASCPNWAAQGICSSGQYASWMAENCAKSCGKCAGGGCTKTDKEAACASWAKGGYCNGQYKAWMAENCAKSCTC